MYLIFLYNPLIQNVFRFDKYLSICGRDARRYERSYVKCQMLLSENKNSVKLKLNFLGVHSDKRT
jgi:hypothetical protein